ncbi:MAG: hypothetical protein ACRD0D_05280 [Acidimicrobiales bacterium]
MRTTPSGVSISVVTVTNRPGSIDVTWGALARQTFSDFEWILCDELYEWRRAEVHDYVNDPRLRHLRAPVAGGDLWNLNKSYNHALRHCRGELVVSLQDYIWAPPDGLERFWAVYRAHGPRVFVSGVGNGYAPPAAAHTGGKVSIFASAYSPEAHARRPALRTGLDGRFSGSGRLEAAGPTSWELNWGAAPLEAFYEIGGFHEGHDREFVSCDNLSVAYGAAARAYSFFLDQANECRLLDHRLVFDRPGWEENHGKLGGWERWYRAWARDGCPRLPYLSKPPAGGPGPGYATNAANSSSSSTVATAHTLSAPP